MARVKAVTFDLWDTIVADDSDEPIRAKRGLPSKRDQRRRLLYEAINAAGPIEPSLVELAFDVADAACNHVWRNEHVTWTVRQRIGVILTGLNRALPDATLEQVVHDLEQMEVEIPPDLIPGCDQALAEISQRYPCAIVSDAIVTPGRQLRSLLEKHGVKKYFAGFAFSDEVGHSKPHRSMFESAAKQLGVAVDEMVHVGDREHNDVQGAHALGIKAVLFTATRAADREGSSADAVCERYADLPGIIDDLPEL
ncbi:HAD family hydrolase [Pirellulales bacterium]|nr:HAD family hydrolase [Pirellulales bacterium]